MAFSKEDILQKVVQIISEKLNVPVENIKAEATFQDVGADSLDIVEMIMSFEESFGIEIKDEEAEKIKTIQSAVDHIQQVRTK